MRQHVFQTVGKHKSAKNLADILSDMSNCSPACRQAADCRTLDSSTNFPNCLDKSFSSITDRKSLGINSPNSGWRQRTRASTPSMAQMPNCKDACG